MNTFGSVSFQGIANVPTAAPTVTGANNGVSLDGSNVVLGGDTDVGSDLLNTRQINTRGEFIRLVNDPVNSYPRLNIGNDRVAAIFPDPVDMSFDAVFSAELGYDNMIGGGIGFRAAADAVANFGGYIYGTFGAYNSGGQYPGSVALVAQPDQIVGAQSRLEIRAMGGTNNEADTYIGFSVGQQAPGIKITPGNLLLLGTSTYINSSTARLQVNGDIVLGGNSSVTSFFTGSGSGVAFSISSSTGTSRVGFDRTVNSMRIGRMPGSTVAMAAGIAFFSVNDASGPTNFRMSAGGNFEIIMGGVITMQPNGGTVAPGIWRFGDVVAAASVLDATQFLEISIGGTLYKLALAQ